jgi:hypothetical protein
VEQQTKAAEHTFIQAKLVDLPDGRPLSAALQFFYVCEFLPDSKQAPEARQLYEQIGKDHPEVNLVLKKLGFTR